jgi:hypothetical protein
VHMRLALGSEVDIVSGPELTEGLHGLGERLLGKEPIRPTYSFRPGADLMPAAGPLKLDLGRPPVGRMWNLLGVTTFGADDATTTASAKVAIYCGDIQNVSLVQLKIPALVVPVFQSVTKSVLWCMDSETLFASVTGAAATSPIGVIVHVAEWREADIVMHTGR